MVTKLRYANTNIYLLRGDKGNVLVDTDYAGTLMKFYKSLKAGDLTIKDINYVMATHYHPDHIGLVSELMKQGVKLILADSQTGSVHYSDNIFAREPVLGYEPIDESSAIVITSDESRAFFKDLGIEGEMFYTPSHSEDSISISLDEGICIVGDLEPYEYLAAYEDNEKLRADWDKVLSYVPKVICYAHANEKEINGWK